jgi:hypothetical protein
MFFLPCLVREFNGSWFGFSPSTFVSQTTLNTKFYQLNNGDSIELNDDWQFYFIAIKCLLIVDIKQHDEPPHNQLQKIVSNLASFKTFANNLCLASDKWCLGNKVLQIELNSMIA